MSNIDLTPTQLYEEIQKARKHTDTVTGNITREDIKVRNDITELKSKNLETIKDINELTEDVRQLKLARTNIMDTIKRLNIDVKDLENEFIKSVTSPVVIHKESWLKRLFN